MKKLLMLTLIMLLAMPALAHKPFVTNNLDSQRVACDAPNWAWYWDGTFTTETCDTEGLPVWQYGTSNLDPAVDCDGNQVTNVLGTILNADYPSDSGERAILGTLTIDGSNSLLEFCHFVNTENSYDGGNVEIGMAGDWIVIEPIGGYPDDELCDSDSYYAWCVDGQPGFTNSLIPTYARDCFDLSQYVGQTVDIAVKFGSDSSVTYPGWFIAEVRAGGLVTPTQERDWSLIKSLY